jgi:hypothetical protein
MPSGKMLRMYNYEMIDLAREGRKPSQQVEVPLQIRVLRFGRIRCDREHLLQDTPKSKALPSGQSAETASRFSEPSLRMDPAKLS